MKILVTGADGFVGKRLVTALDNQSEIKEVYAIVWKPMLLEGKKIKTITADLSVSEQIGSHKEIKDIDTIIHLAGSPGVWYSEQHPRNDLIQNAATLLSVLELAQNWNVKRVVLASTCQVYADGQNGDGLPDNYYGLSKKTAEEYLRLFGKKTGVEYTILRMSWIYGPGMTKNPIYDLIKNRNSENLNLYCSLNDELDFIYVDDVIQALCKAALDEKWKNKVLDISSCQSTSIRSLVGLLEQTTGLKYSIKDSGSLARKTRFDNGEAVKLGWKQNVGLKEGFLKTVEYFS